MFDGVKATKYPLAMEKNAMVVVLYQKGRERCPASSW
jgi:hypothetical protein